MLDAQDPKLIRRDGKQLWRWSNGTELFVIAGADDGGGAGGGSGDGGTAGGDGGTAAAAPAGGTQGDPAAGTGNDDKLGEGGKKALEAERVRAKKAEDELAAAKAQLKEIEDKDKSELQLAQTRVTELETHSKDLEEKVKNQRAQSTIEAAASKALAKKPAGVFRLVDMASADFDDAGNVKNADALVKTVRDEYPELFSDNGSHDGGRQQSATGGSDMNSLIRKAAGH